MNCQHCKPWQLPADRARIAELEAALATAQRRFELLAVVSDKMVNGVRPSVGATECAAAIGHWK
jgi:hypothetical protein